MTIQPTSRGANRAASAAVAWVARCSQKIAQAIGKRLPKDGSIEVVQLGRGPSSACVSSARVVDVLDLGATASALTELRSGTLRAILLGNDDEGILRSDGHGKARPVVKEKNRLVDLEGLAANDAGTHVYAVAESTGSVFRFDATIVKGELSLTKKVCLGQLPKIGKVANKGWEGLDVVPGALVGLRSGDAIVAVHEGKPRRVGIYDATSLKGEEVPLSDAAKEYLPDIADVAVCRKTGHFFLLSDEGKTVVECVLGTGPDGARELQPLSVIHLPIARADKSEGMRFAADNRLWISLDAKKAALVITVGRAGTAAALT